MGPVHKMEILDSPDSSLTFHPFFMKSTPPIHNSKTSYAYLLISYQQLSEPNIHRLSPCQILSSEEIFNFCDDLQGQKSNKTPFLLVSVRLR